MSKIISLRKYAEKRGLERIRIEATLTNTIIKTIPVAMYAKGKFTLGIYYNGDKRIAVVYNTTTKVPIGGRPIKPDEPRETWTRWAELLVADWQSKKH